MTLVIEYLRENHVLLVQTLFDELERRHQSNLIHFVNNIEPIQRGGILSEHSYSIWANQNSQYYHPRLILLFNRSKFKFNHTIQLKINYHFKRFSKTIDLDKTGDFEEIICKSLDELNKQWLEYQTTEDMIRRLFIEKAPHNIIYCKKNLWYVSFVNHLSKPIEGLGVWYDTKKDNYVFKYSAITDRHQINNLLQLV